ncbi:DUF1467 family protein [Mangrovibrevibacter kandeliae]|uniref:DUF1467 family protein n=1 Tax=Mangrovibrevibacter kandeliae TaxID=2968473 RepID=UPI002117D761|nr:MULTISPECIES: DUF1467 family protein [unclassified Aurantimonas]MCQ8782657.1 DUF1467 family protein [Aurantimonas sp. CSK15Z-1]MCW4114534.1 DUF1467 family protein [Aurantimonas sp. MSK8Z-1]
MAYVTWFAVFFTVWWTVLFAILPIGMRSQAEEGNVTLGTDHGAPAEFRLWRKLLHTTIASLVIVGLLIVIVDVLGFGIDDIPHIIPGT